MHRKEQDRLLERPLPHSAEAERAILGAIILDNGLLRQASESLKPEDFYIAAHRHAFRTMLALSKRGAEINPILLAEELRREGWLEQVGGIAFISELTYGLPCLTNLVTYAEVMREKSALRRLAKLGSALASRALEEASTATEAATWLANELATLEKRSSGNEGLRVARMADVEPEQVSWLWYPYMAAGKMTIIEGDPGLGKSWLTCALAAAISCGRGLPGAGPFEPRNVLMLSAEDGLGDTLRPRLDAVGADVSRIFAVAEPLTLDAAGLILLESAIAAHSPALVIIDPLFAYTGAKVDIHRANECRAISAPLAAIAERHGCALLAVRHLTKAAGRTAMSAGVGSIDFRAAARSVLLVGADPDDPTRRALIQTKNNLAPEAKALGYKLEDGHFWWTGESDLTAGRILTSVPDEEQRSALTEAISFLEGTLKQGAREINEVKAEARIMGISEATLRRARERLGIKADRVGEVGAKQTFTWSLPKKSDDAQQRADDAHSLILEHHRANHSDKGGYDNELHDDAQGYVFEHHREQLEHHQAEEEIYIPAGMSDEEYAQQYEERQRIAGDVPLASV